MKYIKDGFEYQPRKSKNRYEYILNSSDLMDSFAKQKADLDYSLRKEVKRDRYIYNAKGLQNAINKSVIDTLSNELDSLINIVSDGITTETINSINNIFNIPNNKNYSFDIGKAIGKALGKLPFDIIDDILNDDDY